jgi:hypothetical protein
MRPIFGLELFGVICQADLTRGHSRVSWRVLELCHHIPENSIILAPKILGMVKHGARGVTANMGKGEYE